MSVPDTRTTLTYSCSFNWRSKTNEPIVLSIITSALDTRDLLGSRPDRFIPSEEEQYILTNRECWPQNQSGHFGGHRKYSPLPEFEPWDRPAHSLVRRPTARFSSRKLKLRKLVTCWQMAVANIPTVLCSLPCRFWDLLILFRRAVMSIKNQ